MNINSYTGKPYDFRRYNCWHHVRAVRADAGLSTPVFDVMYPRDIAAAFAQGHADSKGMVKVELPQDFDAVLMASRIGSRLIWHAGVYFSGMVSHCALAARQVKLEDLATIKENYQRIEFWR